MTTADALQGVRIIALDAGPFIYYLEGHTTFGPLCAPFFSAIAAGQITAVTSALTLAETLTVPLRNADSRIIAAHRNILSATQGFNVVPVSLHLAEQAADLRARYNLRTPDAVQIATAISAGADAFLTNDAKLSRVVEIRVIVLGTLTL